MENLNEDELSKAKNEGFIHRFEFSDGQLHCVVVSPSGYYPKDIQIRPFPCFISKEIIYRIITNEGLKGHAVNVPEEPQNEF